MATASFHHGDVVLVPYPLTEPSPSKRRPAVILSSDHYNSSTGEIMIAPVTAHGRSVPRIGDHTIIDWQEAGLLGPATVRTRLITIRASHVLRRIGAVSQRDMAGLSQWLRRVMDL